MDTELMDYIFNYCYEFYSDNERKAKDHYVWTFKFEKYKDTPSPLIKEAEKKLKSIDPSVLELLKDGYQMFMINTAKRIYKDNKDNLKLNLCPQCKKIARTPHAKQCRFCGYDWH